MENLAFNFHTILFFSISYLIGSIPFGYLIYKLKKNDDIRKYGSGNIGATNVNRLLGKKLGFATLFFDFSKTFCICLLINNFYGNDLAAICGLLTILGHIFPIWLKFKGGKGVASFLGMLCLVSWPLTLIFCFVWLISVKFLKFSAAGAIIAIIFNIAIFQLILLMQFYKDILFWIPGTPFEFKLIFILSIIILYKHHSNLTGFLKK